jgi:hypothetical protein
MNWFWVRRGLQKDSSLLDGYRGRLHAACYSVAPSGPKANYPPRFVPGLERCCAGWVGHPEKLPSGKSGLDEQKSS